MPQAISPNWHVILIHYPIALLSLGLLIEIFGFLWRRSSVRTAARWMLLIGALSCIPALTSGLYAFEDAAKPVTADVGSRHWFETTPTSPLNVHDGKPWEFLRRHIIANAIASGILCIVVIGWLGSSDLWRRRMYALYLLLVIASVGLLTFGAWNGGESIYRFGTAVRAPQNAELNAHQAAEQSPEGDTWQTKLTYFVPPLQLHILLAGVVVALGVVGLGLSIRGLTSSGAGSGEVTETRQTSVDPLTGKTTTLTTVQQRTTTLPHTDVVNAPGYPPPSPQVDLETALRTTGVAATPTVPAARWWLLGTLIAILTAAAGIWSIEWFSWDVIHGSLWPLSENTKRYFVHTVCGVSIIILTLLLGIAARFGRRNKIFFSIAGGLLVIAIALQIWMGVLLLFDTGNGPINRFAQPNAAVK